MLAHFDNAVDGEIGVVILKQEMISMNKTVRKIFFQNLMTSSIATADEDVPFLALGGE